MAFSTQGELQRGKNISQVIQKMMAGIKRGYLVFVYPIGYLYSADRMHDKIISRYELEALIIQEHLKDYANERFSMQCKVKRFSELSTDFPILAFKNLRFSRSLVIF